jgi:small GTP-binding protein
MTIEEDIKNIEDEIRKTPYNKATSHHIGRLKAKLARLRDELQKRATAKSAGKGKGYGVKKSGDATVIMVGFPSVGKSTLLNCLTGTSAEVAAYDFTTLEVIPGTLLYKGAQIQFLDVPGLIQGAATGRGHGKEVISVMRNADLILIIVDVFQPQQFDTLVKELYDAGIRINTKPPEVVIHKASRGGITVNSTVDLELAKKTIRAVLSEYKIHNAEVLIRERITLDELIRGRFGHAWSDCLMHSQFLRLSA